MRLYDYTASANCLKVRLLLGLLERKCERIHVDIFAGDMLSGEYLAINPARETPILELDDGARLFQSNAILWYLAEGTRYLPDASWERAQLLQWLMFEQEYVIPGIAAPRFWLMTGRGGADWIEARLEIGRQALARLDRHLATHPYLVGDLTIADISVYAYTHAAADATFALDGYPNLSRWHERLESTPRFINDLAPYPKSARLGPIRSID